MTEYYITGIRRGLGQRLWEEYGSVDRLEDCDVFINCKHDGFSQVELLYRAAALGKRVINIGSNAADGIKKTPRIYSVQKMALDKANEQLFYQGVDTSIIRFSYIDSPSVAHVKGEKISLDECVDTVEWVLSNPNRVKEVTICK